MYNVEREYFLHEGEQRLVQREWYFSRTLWLLTLDLPYYTSKDGKISPSKMPKGSFVLVITYSYDGWLYLVCENGERGYIKMTLNEDGSWSDCPLALPSGEPMEYVFYEYGGAAG